MPRRGAMRFYYWFTDHARVVDRTTVQVRRAGAVLGGLARLLHRW